MINIQIDSALPKSEVDTIDDAMFDAKQLAAHIVGSDYLRQVVVGALVWAELMTRGDVRGNEFAANDALSIAFEEAEQLTSYMADGVYN